MASPKYLCKKQSEGCCCFWCRIPMRIISFQNRVFTIFKSTENYYILNEHFCFNWSGAACLAFTAVVQRPRKPTDQMHALSIITRDAAQLIKSMHSDKQVSERDTLTREMTRDNSGRNKWAGEKSFHMVRSKKSGQTLTCSFFHERFKTNVSHIFWTRGDY